MLQCKDKNLDFPNVLSEPGGTFSISALNFNSEVTITHAAVTTNVITATGLKKFGLGSSPCKNKQLQLKTLKATMLFPSPLPTVLQAFGVTVTVDQRGVKHDIPEDSDG